MKYKMIIYDCDGVIFNSEKANFEYYKYLFNKFNLPEIDEHDQNSLTILHTYSNDKVIDHFATNEEVAKKIKFFSKQADYSMFYPHMRLEPEFKETCKQLKRKGFKVTVATNRSHTFEGIVEFFKLYELIDDYVTVLDSKVPKPEPDMLLLLLERHNMKKEEAVFIGDSLLDFEAAKNAGIDFLFYKYNRNNHKHINSHFEIFKYL